MQNDHLALIFGVKDNIVGEVINIFSCPNEGVAKRAFAQSINTANHPMRQNYKDYDLVRLCGIDLKTGIVNNVTDRSDYSFICHGSDVYQAVPIDIQSYLKDYLEKEKQDLLYKASNESGLDLKD